MIQENSIETCILPYVKQINSPSSMNETDLFSLIDTEFKKKVMKILKELREVITRNADHYKNELATVRKNQEY